MHLMFEHSYFCLCSGDASLLRRRYDDLLGGVRQQKHHLEDAKTRRQDLDSALEAFLPQLSALEERCEGISGDGVSQPERIQARVEAVQVRGGVCVCLCFTVSILHLISI